jgi:hypothetical protein
MRWMWHLPQDGKAAGVTGRQMTCAAGRRRGTDPCIVGVRYASAERH